ncbi:MAG: hypothetical protein M1816_006004 [Peltula sp. TS41687]|nr:MAG: hypothetical protein M1816_006004 [Peltula sp. TS41687]
MNQDLLIRLSEHTWNGSLAGESDLVNRNTVYDHILEQYLPSNVILNLAVASSLHRNQAERTLWRVVTYKLDNIWAHEQIDYPFNSPVSYGQACLLDLAMYQRRDMIPGPKQCRELRVIDDPAGLLQGRQAVGEHVRSALWSIGVHLRKDLPSLRIFRWESKVRMSMRLLDRLALCPNLRRFEWTLAHDAMSLYYPRPGYQPERYGREPDAEGLYRAGWDPQASLLVPTGQESLTPAMIDCAESIITLEGAYQSSVVSLMHVLERRFTRVKHLNIYGPHQDDEPLPASLNEAPLDFFDELLNRGRGVAVESLSLHHVDNFAGYVTQAIDPSALQSLEINCCALPEGILVPLAHLTPNLVAFHFFSPMDNPVDELEPEDRHEADLGEGPEFHNLRGEYPWDLVAACDFVRCAVTGLKSLTMIGHFSGGHGRELHEYLFTAIQAQLSSLEQLTVLDGQSAELTKWRLREIVVCAPLLADLRIRATLPSPSQGNLGLMNHLPALLPEFRALKVLTSLRTEPTNDSAAIRERDFLPLVADWAAKMIPLRAAAYYSPTPSDKGDKPSVISIWVIRRPTDPREPVISGPQTTITERKWVGEMHGVGNDDGDSTSLQKTFNIDEALRYLRRNLVSFGISQPGNPHTQWPKWW